MIELENSKGRIAVDLQGAYVMSYVPAGGSEVLFAAKGCRYERYQWRNQGIPISWPWFDELCENPKEKPIHGVAWGQKWSVVSLEDGADLSRLVLALESSDETKRFWPYDFALRYEIELGDALTVRLTTTNRDAKPMTITTGFHPYFAVSSLAAIRVAGLGTEQDVITAGYHRFIPADDLKATLTDAGAKREIRVSAKGNRQAVIWNCGKRWSVFGDFTEADVDKYICIEPQVIPETNAVTVEPGGTHVIEMTVGSR